MSRWTENIIRCCLHILFVTMTWLRPVTSDCGGASTTYNNGTGIITSLGYPNGYATNQYCTWFISLSGDEYPVLVFTVADLSPSTEVDTCAGDYIEVSDRGIVLLSICGTIAASVSVTAISHNIQIRFITDGILDTENGFSMQWFSTNEPAELTTEMASTTTVTTGFTWEEHWYIILLSVLGVFIICFLFSWRAKKQKEGNAVTSRNQQISQQAAGKAAPKPKQTAAAAPTKPKPTAAAAPTRKKPTAAPATVSATTKSVSKDPPPAYQSITAQMVQKQTASQSSELENQGPHIMISYQWNVKPQVLKFKERLVEEGYRVWIDTEQMHKSASTFEAMADAVKRASVVVPVLTEKYTTSENCKKEIQFADKCKKTIIPVRMEKKYVPGEDWLGFLLGNIIWYDLSTPETYEANFINFLGAIANQGNLAKLTDAKDAGYKVFGPR